MAGMDDRERAYENKFAHDAELRFKAEARRNRMLGRWAAERMGITGAQADAYASDVVKADFQEAGDEDVLRKVSADFADKGVAISDTELRAEMDRMMAEVVDALEKDASA